jgi:hypothetical protein
MGEGQGHVEGWGPCVLLSGVDGGLEPNVRIKKPLGQEEAAPNLKRICSTCCSREVICADKLKKHLKI